MSIKVVQLCNGCAATREINAYTSILRDAENGGWREVKPNTHLCPVCIRDAIKVTPGGKSVSS